jgi:type IV fimbrial biogenesis protein FimT
MKQARGFTLMELMVTVLVLGIVLGFTVPSFREMTRNNRIAASQNTLLTALAVARNEALHRSSTVSICASTNGTSCGTKADWNSGWIVFKDLGTLGTFDAATDEVLQKWGALEGDTKIKSDVAGLTYAATGMQTGTSTTTLTVYYLNCTGPKARLVSVGVIGSVTASQTDCPTS